MLGITTYSCQAATPLALECMKGHAKQKAHAIAGGLMAAGSTALYAGLEKGIRHLCAQRYSHQGVDAIFLCTDGHASVRRQPPSTVQLVIFV